ncbi:MAG: hypothetical protein V7642_2782 [Burkholderiales bacterium]|jgi:uncharacterized cupin superfamily protein
MPNAIRFQDVSSSPVTDYPAADRQLHGAPQRTTWTHYINATGEFECGIWESEEGGWRTVFHEHKEEYFYVLDGLIRLTARDGETRLLGPGDACVIPAGFAGTFEVLKRVRKHYVIFERGQA